MKHIHVYAFVLMSVFNSSCGQNQTNLPKDTIMSESKDAISSQVPNSMVRHVRQAGNGNILIASFQGVFRYDGKSFTNITRGIPSPSFWDVLEDRKGNLWFASRDSGVYCYNGNSFQHFTTRDGFASNSAFQIYEDKAGNIWFATRGGASRYDGTSFRNFTTKDGLPNNNITSIMEDRSGKFWIGTRGDACIYDGKTFTVFKNKDSKAFYNVWSIIEDRKGNIWFGGSIIKDSKKKSDKGTVLTIEAGGLWRYDGNTFNNVTQRGASAIIEDKQGNIWTTGPVKLNGDWALSRYDQKSLYNKNPSVTEIMSLKGTGFLCGILEAKDGSIWFGSAAGPESGVYRYEGKTITDF